MATEIFTNELINGKIYRIEISAGNRFHESARKYALRAINNKSGKAVLGSGMFTITAKSITKERA